MSKPDFISFSFKKIARDIYNKPLISLLVFICCCLFLILAVFGVPVWILQILTFFYILGIWSVYNWPVKPLVSLSIGILIIVPILLFLEYYTLAQDLANWMYFLLTAVIILTIIERVTLKKTKMEFMRHKQKFVKPQTKILLPGPKIPTIKNPDNFN